MSATTTTAAICLVSMPWPLLNRPSIQLGVLKAFIEQESDCKVATFHPYLQIAKALGPAHYTSIAEASWGAEALFAALIFPGECQGARRVFTRTVGKVRHELHSFDRLVETIDAACRDWLATINWSEFSLIGLSLCFNQLFSSLYLAKLLKELPHCPPIVFGGSLCAGELGASLLAASPQIDYVIDGEGELPLLGLIDFLTKSEGEPFPERVVTRHPQSPSRPAPEITDLNTLPSPDFTPYFEQMHHLFPQTPFVPVLPVEFSRGCWWNRCSFCNLNLQWCGYRHKKDRTMLRELGELHQRHQCLDYTFTDNALPPTETDSFFSAMAQSEVDCRFFAEIRAINSPEKLAAYRQGGLDTIQVGVESLVTSLLAKMQKGTRAIDNIAMLKHAQAAGITLEGNLIMEFPGATEKEIEQTLAALDFVLPYHPLVPATFFLGHGSPVARDPKTYQVAAVTVHPNLRSLLPAELTTRMSFLIKGYRGDKSIQKKRWRPVREKLDEWRRFHDRRGNATVPPLSYRDGKTFLLIRQEIPDDPPLRHRLKGRSREIYLFCDTIKTIGDIAEHFPGLTESAIESFVHQLQGKRLMYREQDRVLSLAIRQP